MATAARHFLQSPLRELTTEFRILPDLYIAYRLLEPRAAEFQPSGIAVGGMDIVLD